MPLREYLNVILEFHWNHLHQFKNSFLPAQEEFSANVCVCEACLPQLEIAADCNLKSVYFFPLNHTQW